MNILCVASFILEYQMQDVSSTFQAFEKLIYEKNIAFNLSQQSMYTIDFLNYAHDPQQIKELFTQTRILDYLYNPDNNTLDHDLLNANFSLNDSSIHYFLFLKNRFLGMTFQTIEFSGDQSDNQFAIDDFFTDIYSTYDDVFNREASSTNDSQYITDRGCQYQPTEAQQYLFSDSPLFLKTLFIPGNITKCQALNIAFLENQMIDENNQEMYLNLYFINQVTQVIFNYQIAFTRDFTYGNKFIIIFIDNIYLKDVYGVSTMIFPAFLNFGESDMIIWIRCIYFAFVIIIFFQLIFCVYQLIFLK